MTIEARNVTKSFVTRDAAGQANRRFLALDRMSLAVGNHEFVSLLGASGCGKSTLLKMIDGLVRPDSGEVLIDGRRVRGPGPDRAMVFEHAALMPWADVLTNVAFSLELRNMPKAEREERARTMLAAVGLAGFERAYPHQLSGGMRQRAALARAFVTEPGIMLMDEPFGLLDALTRQVLQVDLLDLWEERRMTVVFVTHSIEEAVFLSDRIVVMTPRPGRVAEIVDVRLPRPRSPEEARMSREFAQVSAHLWETLKGLLSLPVGGKLRLRPAEGA